MAHLAFHTPETGPEPPAEGRLDSWKEIATYLRRDVRTVQRWEKSEGLPVRRHQHDSLGSVYAFRHELDAWREGRQPLMNSQESALAARTRSHRRRVALGGLLVLAGAGLAAFRLLPDREGTAPILRGPVQLTNDRLPKLPILATDGPCVYVSEMMGEHWVVTAIPVAGGAPAPVSIPLTGPAAVEVSPDGTEMLILDQAGWTQQGGIWEWPLYRVPVGGGTPTRVGDLMTHGASWFPDGRGILYLNGRNVNVADRDGSTTRTLVTLDRVPAYPRVSPDGRLIRFSMADPRDGSLFLWEVAADGADPHPLFESLGFLPGGTGSWSSDGEQFFFASSRNGAAGIWVADGRPARGPRRGAEPRRVTVGTMPVGIPLPSRDGRQLFVLGELAGGELMRYDTQSRQFVRHSAGIQGSMLDFSRDGQWIAYVAFPSSALWRARTDGTERRQLTAPPLEVGLPRWSPDGERIAFMARAPGQAWRVYAVPSNGGSALPLTDGQFADSDPGWSPDGRSLVFGRALRDQPSVRLNLQVLDVSAGRMFELPGSEGMFSPRWSPDGRHVAALPADSQKLAVLDLQTGQWSEPVAGDAGFPAWSGDGTRLYFQRTEQGDEEVIYRLRLRDGRTERVASRKGVPRSYTFGGLWFGLDPEDRLLIMRDQTVTELFAFDLAFR